MQTHYEDESMRDNSKLEVRQQCGVGGHCRQPLGAPASEGRTEHVSKLGNINDDHDEGDSRQREVETVHKSIDEDLGKIP